jgi:hypothetical protein
MTDQPDGGVETIDRLKPKLSPAGIFYFLALDAGQKHREERVSLVSLDHFHQEFMPEIEVAGVRIPLSANLPPLPLKLTKFVLEQPTSDHRVLAELLNEIEVASTNDLLQIAGPLPKD